MREQVQEQVQESEPIRFIPMDASHYDDSISLWKRMDGLVLSGADSREAISAYLERNPGLSLVAASGGRVVGTLMAGHDGRRGWLYHLAVDPEFRGRGIGGELAERCLRGLGEAGIERCYLMVMESNGGGAAFWTKAGWEKRDGILLFSRDPEKPPAGADRSVASVSKEGKRAGSSCSC
ncbi:MULTISPECIES: GNAT family N-acetyltransferase [unclassified Paenibacillus]|uniref:GNAT family N-acetyltransferase n=1 Tax=unclassified Paenibacillus TaxID=185978 RepID=UPI001F11E21F|nr:MULTISPECIES: GNAT family N-acetyltransferase [unclassified Paenibacillus]